MTEYELLRQRMLDAITEHEQEGCDPDEPPEEAVQRVLSELRSTIERTEFDLIICEQLAAAHVERLGI